MTFDDLERKIIEIRKRGLNIVVQTELIGNIRGEYYDKLIAKKQNAINDLFKKNIFVVGEMWELLLNLVP